MHYVNIKWYNVENGTTYSCNELLGSGVTNTLDDVDLFGLDSEFLNNNLVFIKKYDWGIHLHNLERLKIAGSPVNTAAYSAIVTTPEGHYSYYYRDHYVIDTKYASVATKCYEGDKKYMANGDTRVGNDENITKDSFDWKLIVEQLAYSMQLWVYVLKLRSCMMVIPLLIG